LAYQAWSNSLEAPHHAQWPGHVWTSTHLGTMVKIPKFIWIISKYYKHYILTLNQDLGVQS
jgi:hypothetical protein